jgi:PAS domain S-box-containing protein
MRCSTIKSWNPNTTATERMKSYRNLGIEKKMEMMTLIICGAVLVVAIAALFTFQLLHFRFKFEADGMALANIIGNNSTGALSFKDDQAATEILGALSADSGVISASLVFPDGSLFAHYGKTEDEKLRSQFPDHRASVFFDGQLLVTQPVRWKGEWLGTLHLRTDYHRNFVELVRFYGQMIGAVILVSVLMGVLLSRRLSRTITDPVLELAKTARIVGEKQDYSVRAASSQCGDELGRLTESFNEMLGRIQSQDAALNLSQQKMEALIHSIDGIVWERTPDNKRFTFISRQSESILGYAPATWLEQPDFWAGKLDPHDSAKVIQTGQELAALGRPYAYEYRILAADGRTVWIRESGMLLVENGHPVALRGIMLDITRQKKDAEELDKLNRKLIDTSRQAGMADVATGVLHNVGNVLNSVGVAATVVGERLRRSKVVNLRRATTMLREQNGHLAEYLTNDPKGKLLPAYLDTVADQLTGEQTELIAEMQSVGQHIEHIKEIVAMQQSYAKVSGANEILSVADLVEDALRINATSFTRHGIRLVREYTPDLPVVSVDRHKVLQILINLLRNAKHATEELEGEDKQIVVCVGMGTADRVKITVRDNGIGIPAEHMTKIFNQGFTTKKDGHGFGLHSGANAAKEMGGSLMARSDGPGKGAEFVLELPVVIHHVAAESSPITEKI